MAGFVPAIHVLAVLRQRKDVDARDKPGHDESLKTDWSQSRRRRAARRHWWRWRLLSRDSRSDWRPLPAGRSAATAISGDAPKKCARRDRRPSFLFPWIARAVAQVLSRHRSGRAV